MIVKIERADGKLDFFETDNYVISKAKDFHPIINSVTIYSESKKVEYRKRHFKFFYTHFGFKSKKVQEILENERKMREEQTIQNNRKDDGQPAD